ncbi:DNA-directed RNA polymerase III subunit rpc3 isoform X2 [Mangifera indica]|uniref:DNA-directed RNA polymerase III subunit rpc3 isoform X2 n=1 Tax=Mangifera indica TaxID=29780 RepID=UPI001CFA03CF|nr:DNA-directed RNA polymerase III subunit rpc3 isoform X2 [Mangifera indica]
MVVPQYGIKFAVHIITNHFGDRVAKVCECLLRRGPLNRPNIKRYTELTDEQVKNSLLVLIQQNCVQAFIVEQLGGFGDEPRLNTQYVALFDNILHRVRFAKFLTIASQEFDKQCVELLQGLLEHGRLTLKQMFERAKSRTSVVLDSVRESLSKLATAHYVERCPAPEPLLMAATEEETPARKRGSKSSKLVEEPETIEQRAVAAAAPVETLRFSVISTDSGVHGENNDNNLTSITVGQKRKHNALESDESRTADELTVLYRANFEEFIRHLRHKACIETVRARLDDGAATVLGAMLEATRSSEQKVKTRYSVPLSLGSIYEEVIKREAGRNMTLDHAKASLNQLGYPPLVKESNGSYSIEFEKIIELAQNDEMESVVLKKYGRDAYRIFRLLSKANCLLETDKISDITFVEKKDTLKILHKMWKDEYLDMEKLFMSGARQSVFFLWKVNKTTLSRYVLDEMFHAALNLSLRLAHELDQEKELLNLPADRRTGHLLDRYNRLKKVRILLESSQMKLDDAIMLFHYF